MVQCRISFIPQHCIAYHGTVQRSIAKHGTLSWRQEYSIMYYGTVLHRIAKHSIAQRIYYIVLYSTIQYYIVLCSIVQYCKVLYCTMQYYIILYSKCYIGLYITADRSVVHAHVGSRLFSSRSGEPHPVPSKLVFKRNLVRGGIISSSIQCCTVLYSTIVLCMVLYNTMYIYMYIYMCIYIYIYISYIYM